MASAYLKLLQDLKESACRACGGTGKQHDERLTCTTCYGSGISSSEHTHNHNQLEDILTALMDPEKPATLGTTLAQLEGQINIARAQAIGWCWTEACSQHAKGLDPHRTQIPALVEHANIDLNPVTDKSKRPAS